MAKKIDFNTSQKKLFLITMAAGLLPYIFRIFYSSICRHAMEGVINEMDLLLFSVTLTVASFVDTENIVDESNKKKDIIRTELVIFLIFLVFMIFMSIVIEAERSKINDDRITFLISKIEALSAFKVDTIKYIDLRIIENRSADRANDDSRLVVFFIAILFSIISGVFTKKIILRKVK